MISTRHRHQKRTRVALRVRLAALHADAQPEPSQLRRQAPSTVPWLFNPVLDQWTGTRLLRRCRAHERRSA